MKSSLRVLLSTRSVSRSRRGASLLVAAALLLTLSACVSATPQKRAAQALDTIATSVDAGMKAAAALYKEGRAYRDGAWIVVNPSAVYVTDAQWTKLAELHEKYRRAGKAAALAIEAAGPGLSDPDLFLRDVSALAAEVKEFIALLNVGVQK